MKWDFFYDENEGEAYTSLIDWEQKTWHLQCTLIAFLLLVFLAFLFFSIIPIS